MDNWIPVSEKLPSNLIAKNKTCLTCEHFSKVAKVEVRKQIEISGYEAVMNTVTGFAFSGYCARLLDFCEYEQCGCGDGPTINGNFGCYLHKKEKNNDKSHLKEIMDCQRCQDTSFCTEPCR